MPREVLWTVKDAAFALRVHPETIRRWIRSGRLNGSLPGGRKTGYRISTEELEPLFQETRGRGRECYSAIGGESGERVEFAEGERVEFAEFVESGSLVSIDGEPLPTIPLQGMGPFATNSELVEYMETCLRFAGFAMKKLRRRLDEQQE